MVIHLQKNNFLVGIYNKLIDKKIDPFLILQKIGNNAQKIDLLVDKNLFNNFNITDVFEYYSPNEFSSLSQNRGEVFIQVTGTTVVHYNYN